MKLICLNLWGGKLLEPLLAFLKTHAADADIFCFQEVFDIPADVSPLPELQYGDRADLLAQLRETLPGFHEYFAAQREGVYRDQPVDLPIRYGLATFVRDTFAVRDAKELVLVSEGEAGVSARWPFALPRKLQLVTLDLASGPLTIANFHGLLDDGDKRDTPLRLKQFRAVRDILRATSGRKIFCGDLNVYPDTESIRMFVEAGMKDLVKDFAVPTTRNHNYTDMEKFADYVSDYAFTSSDISVRSFTALPDEVSDHMALLVEFDI